MAFPPIYSPLAAEIPPFVKMEAKELLASVVSPMLNFPVIAVLALTFRVFTVVCPVTFNVPPIKAFLLIPKPPAETMEPDVIEVLSVVIVVTNVPALEMFPVKVLLPEAVKFPEITALLPTSNVLFTFTPPEVTIAPIDDPDASVVLVLVNVPEVTVLLPKERVPVIVAFPVTFKLEPIYKLLETDKPPAKLPLPVPNPLDSVVLELENVPDIESELFKVLEPATVKDPPILHDFTTPRPPAVLSEPLETVKLSVESLMDNFDARDELPVPDDTMVPELEKFDPTVRLAPVKIFLPIYAPPEICSEPEPDPVESIVEELMILPLVLTEPKVTAPVKEPEPDTTAFPPM